MDNQIEEGDNSVASLKLPTHSSALELDMNNVAPVTVSSSQILESDIEAYTESDINNNSLPEVQETSTSTTDGNCRACNQYVDRKKQFRNKLLTLLIILLLLKLINYTGRSCNLSDPVVKQHKEKFERRIRQWNSTDLEQRSHMMDVYQFLEAMVTQPFQKFD